MLKQFFIICSGADRDLLNSTANGEQNKYAGIGATVFFTALMAFVACSYALFVVFDQVYLAIGFGLIWGLLIFNLDRFIVSTIKKKGRFWSEFIQATPRLILALIIAIVISKPLELKIFEKEINQVLLEQKNDLTLANKDQIALQYTPKIEALETDISNLKSEVETKTKEVDALYAVYITEAEGTSGTKKLGKGPVYKEKREKHDAALAELETLKTTSAAKIEILETKIAALKTDYATNVNNTQPIIDGFDGLMARVNALNQLPWLPSFFILLLFLAIETSPIFAKLLSPKGEYDYKLEDHETAVKSLVEQRIAERKLAVKTDFAINNRIYNTLSEDEETYDKRLKQARELMNKQAEAHYKKQEGLL
ncbi:DUF4407 domain-containing protein [Aurantibacter aestuarii]|uniref:DUF4407 domain-containing protein n=1 Tax=Aurantibacter aestuarii TaxID=1266046 RepID=A0A2T1NC11_9FLAO|nr:DUF4407 domain-containing protein [Aurantibacter aestuarii]PSG89947.1 DUF4407 domain-containing protein [Aurantibacter aestuarii]